MLRTSSRCFGLLRLLVLVCASQEIDSHQTFAASGSSSSVVYTAHDYGFTGPAQIAAGVATLQVVNKGREPHHVQLLQLLRGKTVSDFRAAIQVDPERFPSWIKFVGGPNAVLPGSDAVATMTLAEGEYLLICLIPDKEGVPHVARGMVKPLSVKGARPSLVSEPKAGLAITQADFRFGMSSTVTAGTHTIQVLNHGTQPHEVVVLRLDPGASAKDFGAAFEPGASGPPPGQPIGGVVGIETGQHAYFNAHFEPGRYGLICFFPDPVTGKPHFAQGMTSEFTVE